MATPAHIAALAGRTGAWPFAGAFTGSLSDDGPMGLAWAGRVTSGADLALAWRASRLLEHTLARPGLPRADRRHALAIAWARLDGVQRDLLGPNAGDGVSVLLIAWDAEGVALSGVGLEALYASDPGSALAPWLAPTHPLFGLPGLTTARPMALTVDSAPSSLIAVAHGDGHDLAGLAHQDALLRCGARR